MSRYEILIDVTPCKKNSPTESEMNATDRALNFGDGQLIFFLRRRI